MVMSDGMSLAGLRDETGQNPELENLREHNRRLIKENQKLEKVLATEELIYDRMEAQVHSFPEQPLRDYVRPKEPGTDELEAVLFLADEHAEEMIDSEEMEGLNEHNWEVFLNRQWHGCQVVLQLIEQARKSSVIDKLHMCVLGDQVTGDIHPDDLVGNEFSLPEAVPKVAEVRGEEVALFGANFAEVHYHGIVGNHPRDTKKKAYKKTAERNWDRGIHRIARMLTRNQTNVQWDIPRSATTVVDFAGWKSLLLHGDQIPRTHRVPYYGIESTIQREAGMRYQARRSFEQLGWDMDEIPEVEFDWAFMGHLHHRGLLADSIYICPSSAGANTFSKNNVHQMSLPRMFLILVHPKIGIHTEQPIHLFGAREHGFSLVDVE